MTGNDGQLEIALLQALAYGLFQGFVVPAYRWLASRLVTTVHLFHIGARGCPLEQQGHRSPPKMRVRRRFINLDFMPS